MKEKEFINDNHLIAIFIGAHWYSSEWRIGFGDIKKYINGSIDLKFDTDLDWLEIAACHVVETCKEEKVFCKELNSVIKAIVVADFDKLFEAVVKFIEWYNEKKNKEDDARFES